MTTGLSFWKGRLLTREHLLAGRGPTHLQHGGDYHGKHAQGKAQDIEERDGGEGLFRIQNVTAVHQSVNRKRYHRHLEKQGQEELIPQRFQAVLC